MSGLFRCIGIGWDVGGWMGKRQGVAVAGVTQGGSLEWLGRPAAFELPEGRLLDPWDLLREVGADPSLLDRHPAVIAMDAPLGFPVALCQLLSGWPFGQTPDPPGGRPGRWIDSPLAFRATDRHVYRRSGKRPMSAIGEYLGNNATVALAHARFWRQSFSCVVEPMDDAEQIDGLTAIEVYPALVKNPRKGIKGGTVKPWFRKLMGRLPQGVSEGSDPFDAAICAVLAVCFSGRLEGYPRLVEPEEATASEVLETVRREGWIYYPASPTRPASSPS